MSPALVVETRDFVDASWSMYRDVADPVSVAAGRLVVALDESGAMAGSDPGGQGWAADYDKAALATVRATQLCVQACGRLSSMFARSALNYADADAASTTGVRNEIAAAVGSLPPDVSYGAAPSSLPSAAGGSSSPPTGWGLVKHLVGYVWPDGHQDRLHAAAMAWSAAAEVLSERSDCADLAAFAFHADALPEADDISTVCWAMTGHLRELAGAHQALAGACRQLAGHIDTMHSEVEGELVDLLAWTAGIQAVGGVLSFLSFGAAEVPTQAMQAARIAKTATKVGEIIAKFISLARDVADAIPTVQATCDSISATMDEIFGVRLAVAGVTTVRTLPTAVKSAHIAQMAADERLAAGAASNAVRFSERSAARTALPEGKLQAAGNKFFKGATSKCKDYKITKLDDGSYQMEYFAPANNPGYGKRYVQIIDSTGAEVTEYKDTMGPNGFIERKFVPKGE